MKLSDGVEWALHCCSLLGALPPGATVPATRLAEYHDIPAAYLAKHLQSLSQAGVVEAVRGPKGGYRLARPPTQITVLEVVEAVEGDDPAFRCTEIRRRGPCSVRSAAAYPRPCGVARVMHEAEEAWRVSLGSHTIAELMASALEDAPPRQLTDTVVWIQEVAR